MSKLMSLSKCTRPFYIIKLEFSDIPSYIHIRNALNGSSCSMFNNFYVIYLGISVKSFLYA